MLRTETIERNTFKLLNSLMLDVRFLVGGTALALYMGHRNSIDLDFFSQQEFDVSEIEEYLKETYNFVNKDATQNTEATLIGFINGVKIDFIQYNYTLIEPVFIYDFIRLYSIQDIAAMKLTAIAHNGTRLKDFVDIAFLSTKLSLKNMLDTFELKFPKTNKMSAVKGLTYFDDIDFSTKIDLTKGKYRWKDIEKRLNEMTKYPDKIFLYDPVSPNS